MEKIKPESEYDMIDWYKKVVFENYANFEGRARRSEYWYFTLANLIIVVVFFILFFVFLAVLGDSSEFPDLAFIPLVILLIYYLAVFIPGLAVAVRRLHDTDKPGWLVIIGMIPYIGSIGGIVLLVFYCLDSDMGRNKYGPNPKGIGNDFH